MTDLWFSLESNSTEPSEKVLDEINKVLNLQMKPSECDWYDGDPVWEASILGMQIELHYFAEDNTYYLSGNTSEEFREDTGNNTEINDISESIADLFRVHSPQTGWGKSLCLECIALTESKKIYQSSPFHSMSDDADDGSFEPEHVFLRDWIKRFKNTSLYAGISFWKFTFDRTITNFPQKAFAKWFLDNQSLYEAIGYTSTINSERPIELKKIDNPLIEWAMLLSKDGFGSSLTSEKAKGIAAEFMLEFHLGDSICLKGQRAWNSWFASDAADFFYVLIKGNHCWILGFSESD